MSKLLHIKGSRTQVLKTLPTNDTGNDGDIVISVIQGRGIYLCIKANNRWYVSPNLEELRKIGKPPTKDLKDNINRAVKDLRIIKRLEALEKRVAELEAKGITWAVSKQ